MLLQTFRKTVSSKDRERLWAQAPRDLCWTLSKTEWYPANFFAIAEGVISTNDKQTTGTKLFFEPAACMFEGCAEQVTKGFFDIADCPPPAFWHSVDGDFLISHIPKRYLRVARNGVDISVSALQWLD